MCSYSKLMIVSASLFVLLLLQADTVESIQCYSCREENGYICQPLELFGNQTKCADGVQVCYKSWTVEADPKTVRKCGKVGDKADEGDCAEALLGANKIIACRCGKDMCNSAIPPLSSPFLAGLTLVTAFILRKAS